MNPSLLLLLAGGAVVVVAAASSKPSAPTTETLVDSSQKMVRIFDLYSRSMSALTNDEMEELGRLVADSKGIEFVRWTEIQNFDLFDYVRKYFLPSNADREKGPDFFTGWSSTPFPERNSKNDFNPLYEPWLDCYRTQGARYDQGSTTSGHVASRRGDCYRGTLRDFFWREVGTFEGDEDYGKSEFMTLVDGISSGLKDVWGAVGSDVLKTTADIASNFPGIGTAVAAAATFLEAIGSGESVESATLAAARGSVPSSLRAMYDIGVGLATQGKLDIQAALTVAMATAISSGVISGDVLEKYKVIQGAYLDAKEAGVQVRDGLEHLGAVTDLAVTANG